MNILYLVSLCSSLFFFSPAKNALGTTVVAEFQLYRTAEGEIGLISQYNPDVFSSDCDAFIAVLKFGDRVCEEQELREIYARDTTKTMKL